jgi:hypothetical protein
MWTYADGSTYRGGVVDGMRHGRGVYTSADGASYDGLWHEDLRSGAGTETSADGLTKYIGGWRNDRRHGEGRLLVASSEGEQKSYEGVWMDSSRTGTPVLTRRRWEQSKPTVARRVPSASRDDASAVPSNTNGATLVKETPLSSMGAPSDTAQAESKPGRSGNDSTSPSKASPPSKDEDVVLTEYTAKLIQSPNFIKALLKQGQVTAPSKVDAINDLEKQFAKQTLDYKGLMVQLRRLLSRDEMREALLVVMPGKEKLRAELRAGQLEPAHVRQM